jgi:ABC-type transport system substrate-binding protein
MTMDRDSWIEAAYDTKSFLSHGLPVETRWNTSLTATENSTGWWLDPKGKDFGKNAKYFEHDVAEAKKLLAAAGFANGLDILSNHFTTGEHGTDFVKLIDLFEGMAGEAGFRFKKNIIPYNQYLQSFRDANGAFDGVTYKSGPPAPSDDPVARLTYEFSSVGGIGFHGFDVEGKGDGSGDPYVESQLAKARVEFDAEKRRPIVHELQRYLAEQQYHLRWPGGAAGFDLAWPAVRNFRVYRPGTQQANLVANTTWWIDETQPPFVKN